MLPILMDWFCVCVSFRFTGMLNKDTRWGKKPQELFTRAPHFSLPPLVAFTPVHNSQFPDILVFTEPRLQAAKCCLTDNVPPGDLVWIRVWVCVFSRQECPLWWGMSEQQDPHSASVSSFRVKPGVLFVISIVTP